MRLLALLLMAACPLPAASPDWDALIRRDHPRLFLNAGMLPQMKARALGEEAAAFADLRRRVESLAGPKTEDRDYGYEAADAAFVFLITREARHRDIATGLLEHSAALYLRRYAEQRAVDWYTFSRICAIAAWDWLYNELEPARRNRIGADLLEAVRQAQPTKERKAFARGMERENWGSATTGFYGTPNLLWFGGLAAYRAGANDDLAAQQLAEGYKLYMQMLEHRTKACGDDGGSASATLGYWLGAYPFAEFNFFHTWRSATGKDISADWPYVATLPSYIYWNWLPGGREFGSGDASHSTNIIPAGSLASHLKQIIYF